MMRTLKVLGLVVAAVFAMAAFGSGSAFAAEELFHCEVDHCILTAEQDSASPNQVFKTEAGTVTCKKVTGDATIAEGVTTVMEITATGIAYSECKTKTIFGEISVEVKMNGCHYLFTTEGQPVHILCEAGKEIEVVGPGCTIKVPAQTPTTNRTVYDNLGTGSTRDITATGKFEGITESASGTFCSKQGTFTNGTYEGNITIKAETTAGVQVGFWYL